MINDEQIDKENDMLQSFMEEKVKELSKYFDSVQLFCTKHENNKIGTTRFTEAAGNYFTRYGQINLWVGAQSKNMDETNDT